MLGISLQMINNRVTEIPSLVYSSIVLTSLRKWYPLAKFTALKEL